MKKISFVILVSGCLFMGTACNDSTSETGSKGKEVAAAAKPEVKCCFVSLEEGQQFFPASTNDVQQVQDAPAAGNLLCGDDAETPSDFTKVYQVGKGKLTLRITDYCVNPRKLELDYERRHSNTLEIYAKDQQVRELNDEKGLYKGFAIFSPQSRTSYLHVLVDGRFSITIAGLDQADFASIFKLFDLIPIDKLASFKK